MIKVEHLVKEFNSGNKAFKAVDDVSFHVNPGEVFGIIGLSGAGKSTLVRCLNRLEEPTSGSIIIDGVDITGLDDKRLLEERRDIGMIFQSFNLFNQRNVYENIAYPLEILKKSKSEIDNKVNELLKFVDLEAKKDSYPSELSGGQKQRVAIARALATNPKILLSDESTSALDPANTEQVLSVLRSAVREYNMTVVMITHQMEVAKNICDRIAVMENGKIIETGTVDEVFNNPKTERTRTFIQALPDEARDLAINRSDFKGKLFRINFPNETTRQPIINNIAKNYDLTVSILSGNINYLASGNTAGYLNVELSGEDSEIEKAIIDMHNNGLRVEEL